MEAACLRHTEIPNTSRLFSDFQYHFDRLSRFYGHAPADSESYAAVAQGMDFPADRRAAIVAALRARNGQIASLDLLAQPGTVAVVTGQQVGLFSGPAYTIYKALTAAKLASQLTARGIPAVPIFWLATEDHDFAEVNHSYVFGPDHRPVQLRVDGEVSERPVGVIPITAPPIDLLRVTLAGFPYGGEMVEAVRQSYAPGATFGSAFQALLQRLLSKQGLLFLDPLDEAIRKIAAPILSEAVRSHSDLSAKLLQRKKDLDDAGYHAQVHLEPKTSLLFLLEGDRRINLRRQNGDFASKDRRYSVAELMDKAEQLSPNALLRPVVQDYILPTVAYVGGPAELAYMAQSQVLYDDLLHRMPVMLSRSGFTLLDGRTGKLLHRYGLTLPAFFQGEDAIRDAIGQKLAPSSLTAGFAEAQEAVTRSLDKLSGGLTAFDATLAEAAGKSRAKIQYQFAKLQRKTAREILKRDDRAAADASYMSGLIYPEKHLQERFYSILPFLAKHGPDLIDTLCDQIHLDCPDHKILVV